MSHLLSPVSTSLDHSARYVCPVSTRRPVSLFFIRDYVPPFWDLRFRLSPTYVCVWRFQLKAETALEITGRKAMGPRNITADGRACCMLRTSRQSAHLRRQRGACFSSSDLVVVQHMCLSGFDRLDPLIQKPVYLFNSFRCSWNRASQSSVFNVKDKKDLDPIYVLVFVIV